MRRGAAGAPRARFPRSSARSPAVGVSIRSVYVVAILCGVARAMRASAMPRTRKRGGNQGRDAERAMDRRPRCPRFGGGLNAGWGAYPAGDGAGSSSAAGRSAPGQRRLARAVANRVRRRRRDLTPALRTTLTPSPPLCPGPRARSRGRIVATPCATLLSGNQGPSSDRRRCTCEARRHRPPGIRNEGGTPRPRDRHAMVGYSVGRCHARMTDNRPQRASPPPGPSRHGAKRWSRRDAD